MNGKRQGHTHTHTMGYYSAIKKENLSFAAKWMDLEGIMLTEIRQRKTNIAWYLLNVKPKNKIQKASEYSKKWTHRSEDKQMITNGEMGRGKIKVEAWKVQTIGCNWGSRIYFPKRGT